MTLKEKDFIEIEYTGSLKDEKIVFDTTDEKTAKESGIFNEKTKFGPVIICLGQKHLLKGLDDKLIGKALGEHEFDLVPEEAFGKKDAKLIQLVSTAKFKKQNITPMPGLQLNIDGIVGTIKTVSGGRTIVDFNHPLSGRDVHYKIKVNKVITDDKEKIKSLLSLTVGVECDVKVEGKKAEIELKTELPEEVKEQLKSQIGELIGIEDTVFKMITQKEEKKDNTQK